MALLGNISLLHKSPAKYTTGTVGFNDRSNWNKPGMMRNTGDLTQSTFWKFHAIPSGMYAGTAFFPPQKAGSIRARESIALTAVGLGVGGITTTGTAGINIDFSTAQAYPLNDSPPARTASASFSINFSNAFGQLISSGSGSASLQFNFANALLTASIGGAGSASLVLSTNTPLLGAITSGMGAASMQITIANAQAYPLNDSSPARTASANFSVNFSNAQAYPLNDTSPARTASGSISFAGALTPYATGSMQGTTVDNSVITSDTIASAVWNAVASSYNEPDTLGNKLNTASTGGVDMTALVNSILEDPRFKKVLTKGTFLALK